MTGIYSKLNNLKVDAILDLATGQGGFLQQVSPLFAQYNRALGVDTSDKALEAAKKNNEEERISFDKMDCSALELEDNSFDVVSICNSIHHFENSDAVLAEALRVLKPGGLFIVSEMYHSEDERPSQQTHSEFHHWWGEVDSALGNYHGRTFSREELMDIIHSLPLKEVDFEKIDGDDEDIYSEEIKKHLTGAFEMYKERASKLSNPRPYVEKGEKLLQKLEKDGFAPASRLEFICTK